jgi:hypothetical protein
MGSLSAPFVASDHGDVSIYESIDAMVALIEPIDALDGGHEFFDADGGLVRRALQVRDELVAVTAVQRPDVFDGFAGVIEAVAAQQK